VRPLGAVSPIGGTVKSLRFRSQQSHVTRTQLHYHMCYSKCNVKPEWFEMRQQNFIVCELKFTNVSAFDVESIVVVNVVFRLSISISILEIYAT